MRVRLGISAILMALSASQIATAQVPAQLVRSHVRQALPVKQIAFRGRDRSGAAFEIVVNNLFDGSVSVDAYRAEKLIGQAKLVASDFPSLDPTSLIVSEGQSAQLIATIRFGQTKPGCFSNDDGRDQVSIYFLDGDTPNYYPERFQNICDK